MATGTIPRQLDHSSFYVAGWQTMYMARTNDSRLFIQIPINDLDPTKTYTASATAGSFKTFTGTSANITTGAATEVSVYKDCVLVQYSIPSGLSTWTYGVVFLTDSLSISST